MTVADARALHETARTLAASPEPIHLAWNQLERMDASVLQLLLAMDRAAKIQYEPAGDGVVRALEAAGLADRWPATPSVCTPAAAQSSGQLVSEDGVR